MTYGTGSRKKNVTSNQICLFDGPLLTAKIKDALYWFVCIRLMVFRVADLIYFICLYVSDEIHKK